MDLSSKVFIYKASMLFVFLDAILFHHKVSYENWVVHIYKGSILKIVLACLLC